MSELIESKREAIVKCFAHIVGQERAKTQLINSACSYTHGGELISKTLVGEAGLGKSALMIAYGKALEAAGIVNCNVMNPGDFRKSESDEWGTLKGMISAGRYYFGIDEAQELWDAKLKTVQLTKIQAFVMRALDGNFQGGNIQIADDMMTFFSRRECSIVLGTNFPGHLPDAVKSRAPVTNLEHYTEAELKTILVAMLAGNGLHVRDEDILGIIARCGRGTARPMEQITRQIRGDFDAVGETKETVSKKDIMAALKGLEMFPRGLSITEIRILAMLKTPLITRTIMMRFPSLDSNTWRKSASYLMSLATSKGAPFVIDNKGAYQTTEAGLRFLNDCHESGFRW